jgi:C_GCAxxG_C_C family probable redox protein
MRANNAIEAGDMAAKAVELALAGYSCSEAVLAAFGPGLGLERQTAARMAAGLAGGIGLTGRTCGVVAASVLVLGLKFGPDKVGDRYQRHRAMVLGGEFCERFKALHGSLECRELCKGMDLGTPEGAKAIRASGIPERLIADAAGILVGMLSVEEY